MFDGLKDLFDKLDELKYELKDEFDNFRELRITPKSRAKVCAQWRILKPHGSLLATDRSKAVVLV